LSGVGRTAGQIAPSHVDSVAAFVKARAIGVPWRMAACNSFYNLVSGSYASSRWVIHYLFDCTQGCAVGANFRGGGNGSGYTPIADSKGPVLAVRPEYCGILFLPLAGQGTLYTKQLALNGLNVTA
jgi:hypothetical protein